MDINKLNMSEEVGEVMDRIVEFFFATVWNMALDQEISSKENADSKSSSLWSEYLPISIVSEGYGIIHVNKRSTVWRKKEENIVILQPRK